jgi:hypothetical protein
MGHAITYRQGSPYLSRTVISFNENRERELGLDRRETG